MFSYVTNEGKSRLSGLLIDDPGDTRETLSDGSCQAARGGRFIRMNNANSESSYPVMRPSNIHVKVNVTMKAKYLHFVERVEGELRGKMTGLIIGAHTGRDSCFGCPEQGCHTGN